jgi:hypothetical protein
MNTLKKISILFLLSYYSLGIVFFPMCDFSVIQDFPKNYQHCKTTEDPNLTVIDFFTEHLIDFDKILDEKENDRNEKPHQNQFHHITTIFVQLVTQPQTTITKPLHFIQSTEKKYSKYLNNYCFIYQNKILHPPIA